MILVLKKWVKLDKNWLFVVLFLFLASLTVQTRLVYFTGDSHIEGDFIFYNTIFLYISDVFLIIAIIFGIFLVISGRFHVKHTRVIEVLLWLGIIATVSTIVSRETIYFIQIFGLFKLFLLILLFCFISNIQIDEKSMFPVKQSIFWLILAILSLQAIIGIIQYFIQRSSGLGFLGEEFLRGWMPGVARFQIPGGYRWIIDEWLNLARGTWYIMRPYGTFPHPNIFGFFMLFGSFFGYLGYYVSRETWKRGVFVGFICLMIFAGIMSFSRVAVISWLIGSVIWFVLMRFTGNKSDSSLLLYLPEVGDRKKMIKSLLFIIIITTAITGGLFYRQFLDRSGIVSYGTTNEEAIGDRALYQKVAFEIIKDKPFFGVGYQNFVLAMDDYSPVELKSYQHQPVHNIYLLVAAETGIIGLTAFLIFIGFILKHAWKKRNDIFFATLLSGFVAMLVAGFFDHYLVTIQQGRLLFFITAGLLVVFSTEERDRQQTLP